MTGDHGERKLDTPTPNWEKAEEEVFLVLSLLLLLLQLLVKKYKLPVRQITPTTSELSADV